MKHYILGLLMAFFSVLGFAQDSGFGFLTPVAPPVNPTLEYRQCGAPARDKDGTIHRSTKVIDAYKKYHPCPVTGLSSGACPGWAINHMIPLAKGGCDAVINMAWLPDEVKSCSSPFCIDRWERIFYGKPHGIVNFHVTPINPLQGLALIGRLD